MNLRVHSTTARRAPAVLVLLAGLAAAGACTPRPSVAVARVSRQPLAQSLVVSGRVLPPVRVNIGTMATGTVKRRLVEEGRHVAAGEPLLLLDDAEAGAVVRQARASVAQLEARLAQLQTVNVTVVSASLAQADATLARASRELQRMQSLSDRGLVTASELDDAKKAVEIAASQHDAAKAQYAGSRPSGVDERAAFAAIEQARAALAAAETRLGQTTIRAPAAGVVIGRHVEAGDIVQTGQTLLQLAVDGPTQLTIDPDEKNLSAISLGQAAAASADAFPSQTFPAVVDFIGAAVDPQRGTIEVRLGVPSPPAFLRPDMTVSVELAGVRRERTLVAASDAIRDVTGRSPWVLVVRGGRVERQSVRVGLRGDTQTEILSGLGEGDLVVPASAGSPEPGTAVRATGAAR
jgi:HlyD family secretion protein